LSEPAHGDRSWLAAPTTSYVIDRDAAGPPPRGYLVQVVPVSLLLDTDIGTDVDDALALAFALRHPGIDLKAVTTVSGDTTRRARIAAKLLQIAGREDVEVAAGIGDPSRERRASEMGHEGDGLLTPGERPAFSERDAVSVLVEGTADGRTHVAAVGALSNISAALAGEPRRPTGLARLAVMGGVFVSPNANGPSFTPADDHNLNVDPAAAVHALNTDLPITYVPLEVTVRTALLTDHLDRLRRADPLCRALAILIDRWAPVLRRTTPNLPERQVAALHDPLTIACLVEPDMVTTERLTVTVAEHEGLARTLIDPVAGNDVDIVRAVDPARAQSCGNDGLDEPARDVVHVPRHGDAGGDRSRRAESRDVGCHRGRGVDDRVVAEHRLVRADPLGIAAPKGVVGEGAGSALGVVDHGDLEQRAVRHEALGHLGDERHVVDRLRGDPPADVADDDRVAELEAEHVCTVDARIEARDHEQAQLGEHDGALMAAARGERAVARER
jgi:purine nucleosidase